MKNWFKKRSTAQKVTLTSITVPLFIELFLNMLMGNADTLMLSQYSDDSVAAVGVANQLLFTMIVLFGFVVMGTSVLIAQAIGSRDYKKVSEISAIAIVTNGLFSLLLSGLMYGFAEEILRWMNVENAVLTEASVYLKWVGGLMFIQALIMTMAAIIRTHGQAKAPLYVTMGMNVVNVIGNYLFIFGAFGFPVLGVEGVAISTVVSRVLGLIVMSVLLAKQMHYPLYLTRVLKMPGEYLKQILRIGIPSAGENLSYNLTQMIIMVWIVSFGTEAVTTRIYTQNLMMFILLASMAVSQGTQILIGYHIGAKEYEKAYERGIKSLKVGMILSLLSALLFTVLADSLFGIFTDNERIIQTGTVLIAMSIILEPGRAINMILINSLRAAGDVKFPLYIALFSMWGLCVGLSYTLGVLWGLGLVGIWISFIADEWMRGILIFKRWKSRKWIGMEDMHQKKTAEMTN